VREGTHVVRSTCPTERFDAITFHSSVFRSIMLGFRSEHDDTQREREQSKVMSAHICRLRLSDSDGFLFFETLRSNSPSPTILTSLADLLPRWSVRPYGQTGAVFRGCF
jgi:hypothetical protein